MRLLAVSGKPSFTIWGTGFGIAITETTVARATNSRRLYFMAKSDRQWLKDNDCEN